MMVQPGEVDMADTDAGRRHVIVVSRAEEGVPGAVG